MHKFNDDLLLEPSDRALAARNHADLFQVLDHPELRTAFVTYDTRANLAKRKGQIAGCLAIALGLIALDAASLEYLFPHEAHLCLGSTCLPSRDVFAMVAASCGALSVLIGGTGALFASKKREWLQSRFVCERIRQFHFQMFVCRLPEIAASLRSGTLSSNFLADRKLWFDHFSSQLEGKQDARFTEILNDELSRSVWLHGSGPSHLRFSEIGPPDSRLELLFSAYRDLRIVHQLDYSNYKLGDDGKIFSAIPRRQAINLSRLSMMWIVTLFVLHLGVILAVLLPWPILASFTSAHVSLTVILIALAALATRALEEGLKPEREVERFQQYRSAIQALLSRSRPSPLNHR
ncbi:hypothetical protein ACU4GH_14155 [Bradyrhizobium betae]